MDRNPFSRITRRGLAKASGAIVTAGALARLERAELALAKDRNRAAATRKGGKKPKPTQRYALLVYGKASGPIYDGLKQTHRMVRYTGTQDPTKYQGVLVDHKYQTVESLSRTRLFKDAYNTGVRIYFLDTNPTLMREVHAQQFGGIRSDAMPACILDRRRGGGNPLGHTVLTAWPVTLNPRASSADTAYRHAVTDPRRNPRAFAEAFGLWLETADTDPATRSARAANPFSSTAPTLGTGFIGQTSQQPVTSVEVPAWGNENFPVYGVNGITFDGAGFTEPICEGWAGCTYCCFTVGSEYTGSTWMVNYDADAGPVTSWTSTPISSQNAVVFLQSVAVGLWTDIGSETEGPALPSGSTCAAPPPPSPQTAGDPMLAMWVSSYISASPDGSGGCPNGNSGNVDLCYVVDTGRGTPYCDSTTGSGEWGVGVRPVPALVGYNSFFGFSTSLTPSGNGPTFDIAGSYPCNTDPVSSLTSGTSHAQGFNIGADFGYSGGGVATASFGYSDEWSVNQSASYTFSDWVFNTTDGGSVFYVQTSDSTYNAWGSPDGSALPPAFGSTTTASGMTTDPTDLNGLQCGTASPAGQNYYVGAPTGQGSADITTTFTYWAGSMSEVVDLMLWDQQYASTQFPTTYYQTMYGGTYPVTWTLAGSSPMINPITAPTTYAVGAWTDPVIVSPSDAAQVQQSSVTVMPEAGLPAYDYTISLILSPGLSNEDLGSNLNGYATLESVTVDGAAVSGVAFGDPVSVAGGQSLTFTVNFTPVDGSPYNVAAYVTSSNPAEALTAGWVQAPISYQIEVSGGRRRSLKDRLTRKRGKR